MSLHHKCFFSAWGPPCIPLKISIGGNTTIYIITMLLVFNHLKISTTVWQNERILNNPYLPPLKLKHAISLFETIQCHRNADSDEKNWVSQWHLSCLYHHTKALFFGRFALSFKQQNFLKRKAIAYSAYPRDAKRSIYYFKDQRDKQV